MSHNEANKQFTKRNHTHECYITLHNLRRGEKKERQTDNKQRTYIVRANCRISNREYETGSDGQKERKK